MSSKTEKIYKESRPRSRNIKKDMFSKIQSEQETNRRTTRDKNIKENREKLKIHQFGFSDININVFKRGLKKPKDCVINAMQMLGIIEETPADLMRVLVGENFGITKEQLQSCFEILYRKENLSWRFETYTNITTLSNFVKDKLSPSRAILCGYDNKHVFLIAKSENGEMFMIDPQLDLPNNMCSLSHGESRDKCFDLIGNKEKYHILKSYIKLN
tara:strand:- start:202 stop:846 length:645 start_codon:yes stop_codon:yes gene_type:complete